MGISKLKLLHEEKCWTLHTSSVAAFLAFLASCVEIKGLNLQRRNGEHQKSYTTHESLTQSIHSPNSESTLLVLNCAITFLNM